MKKELTVTFSQIGNLIDTPTLGKFIEWYKEEYDVSNKELGIEQELEDPFEYASKFLKENGENKYNQFIEDTILFIPSAEKQAKLERFLSIVDKYTLSEIESKLP